MNKKDNLTQKTSARGSKSFLPRFLPNLVTATRILLLPLFVYQVQKGTSPLYIAGTLAIMGITDFLDGFVARRIDGVSTFGKVFDPTADRVVLVVVAIELIHAHYLPLIIAVPLLVREALVSILMIYLFFVQKTRVDVLWVGKAGTFALLLALPALIFEGHYGVLGSNIHSAGEVIAGFGTVVLYYAGLSYVKALRKRSSGTQIHQDGC